MFNVFIKHIIVVKKTFANSLTFASEKKNVKLTFPYRASNLKAATF